MTIFNNLVDSGKYLQNSLKPQNVGGNENPILICSGACDIEFNFKKITEMNLYSSYNGKKSPNNALFFSVNNGGTIMFNGGGVRGIEKINYKVLGFMVSFQKNTISKKIYEESLEIQIIASSEETQTLVTLSLIGQKEDSGSNMALDFINEVDYDRNDFINGKSVSMQVKDVSLNDFLPPNNERGFYTTALGNGEVIFIMMEFNIHISSSAWRRFRKLLAGNDYSEIFTQIKTRTPQNFGVQWFYNQNLPDLKSGDEYQCDKDCNLTQGAKRKIVMKTSDLDTPSVLKDNSDDDKVSDKKDSSKKDNSDDDKASDKKDSSKKDNTGENLAEKEQKESIEKNTTKLFDTKTPDENDSDKKDNTELLEKDNDKKTNFIGQWWVILLIILGTIIIIVVVVHFSGKGKPVVDAIKTGTQKIKDGTQKMGKTITDAFKKENASK